MCEYPVTSFQGYRYFKTVLCFMSKAKARYTEHSSLERHASHHHFVRILVAYSVLLPMCTLWQKSLLFSFKIVGNLSPKVKMSFAFCSKFFCIFWLLKKRKIKRREMFHSLKISVSLKVWHILFNISSSGNVSFSHNILCSNKHDGISLTHRNRSKINIY